MIPKEKWLITAWKDFPGEALMHLTFMIMVGLWYDSCSRNLPYKNGCKKKKKKMAVMGLLPLSVSRKWAKGNFKDPYVK